MACPLRIAVVTASALIAFLALYLTFWNSEPDDLERDVLAQKEENSDGSEEHDEGNKPKEMVRVIAVACNSVPSFLDPLLFLCSSINTGES